MLALASRTSDTSDFNLSKEIEQPWDEEAPPTSSEPLKEKDAVSTYSENFHNSLQPVWDKYVTMVYQVKNLHEVDYDQLYDYLQQNEKNVNASRAKRTARKHNPLAIVANHSAAPSSSHTSSPYYITYPPFVANFNDETQSFEFQGDARKNLGNAGRNTNRVAGNSGNVACGKQVNGNNATMQRVPRTSANSGNTQNVQCYNCNEKGDHEQFYPEQAEYIKATYDDDQIDSKIIFDDPDVKNVQLEAEKTNKIIKVVKEENDLLKTKLEKYKSMVRVFESKPENKYNYMQAYNEALNREKKLKITIFS
ncbi:hypothetical protein Tco_1105855 [Tanacetum coccineum]